VHARIVSRARCAWYDHGVKVDVVPLPALLKEHHLRDRAVVVFDVLRATTTIVSALSAGAREVRVFDALAPARAAATAHQGPTLLCGEQNCLRPEGFDLGNSPAEFLSQRVRGRTVFMSTTNGTRAIAATAGAARPFVAALINSAATAKALAHSPLDVTLLGAGTNGEPAPEDLLGAAAVLDRLSGVAKVEMTDAAAGALEVYHSAKTDLAGFLRQTPGGRNILDAGLAADIDFAARLDVLDVVVEVQGDPPTARVMHE
jgi:2-phosphosulfolactate phosphatase